VNENLQKKIQRYRRFYESAEGGLMTIAWWFPPDFQMPKAIPIDTVDWRGEASIQAYALRELDRMRAMKAVFDRFDDDRIPTAMVFAGTGMISASMIEGAVVDHQPDTNYLHQPIRSWSDGVDCVRFSPDNPWFQAHMVILRTFVENWDGSYGILPFPHFGPTDLANQLRGNDLFTDLYEEEENVHKLLERCTDAILEAGDHIRANCLGGYDVEGFSFGSWAPSGAYLSCDFGDMVSSQALRSFERPYYDRIVAAWGGAYIHHHELGRHQIPVWAENDRAWIQFVHRDPNTVHLSESMGEEIIDSSLRTPIEFIAPYGDLMRNAERWASGKFIVHVQCETWDEVQSALAKVANHRH
jgi:hypothetical protein